MKTTAKWVVAIVLLSGGQVGAETLGWDDIPVNGVVPSKPNVEASSSRLASVRNKEADQLAAEKLEKKHFDDHFVGKHFFGQCEVEKVTPSAADGKYWVTANQYIDIDHAVAASMGRISTSRKYVQWLVDEDEALHLHPDMVFNVSGDIARMDFRFQSTGYGTDKRVVVMVGLISAKY